MYIIHFVADRENDKPAQTATASSFEEAVTGARAAMNEIELTKPSTWKPVAIGFVIYDEAGRELHREYPEGK
jgi:hypothetical protein